MVTLRASDGNAQCDLEQCDLEIRCGSAEGARTSSVLWDNDVLSS